MVKVHSDHTNQFLSDKLIIHLVPNSTEYVASYLAYRHEHGLDIVLLSSELFFVNHIELNYDTKDGLASNQKEPKGSRSFSTFRDF